MAEFKVSRDPWDQPMELPTSAQPVPEASCHIPAGNSGSPSKPQPIEICLKTPMEAEGRGGTPIAV